MWVEQRKYEAGERGGPDNRKYVQPDGQEGAQLLTDQQVNADTNGPGRCDGVPGQRRRGLSIRGPLGWRGVEIRVVGTLTRIADFLNSDQHNHGTHDTK